MGVTFHRLAHPDLPLMHRWLNEPGVVRWWEGDDDACRGARRCATTATDSTEHSITSVDGHDVGWTQCYAWSTAPEEAAQ